MNRPDHIKPGNISSLSETETRAAEAAEMTILRLLNGRAHVKLNLGEDRAVSLCQPDLISQTHDDFADPDDPGISLFEDGTPIELTDRTELAVCLFQNGAPVEYYTIIKSDNQYSLDGLLSYSGRILSFKTLNELIAEADLQHNPETNPTSPLNQRAGKILFLLAGKVGSEAQMPIGSFKRRVDIRIRMENLEMKTFSLFVAEKLNGGYELCLNGPMPMPFNIREGFNASLVVLLDSDFNLMSSRFISFLREKTPQDHNVAIGLIDQAISSAFMGGVYKDL